LPKLREFLGGKIVFVAPAPAPNPLPFSRPRQHSYSYCYIPYFIMIFGDAARMSSKTATQEHLGPGMGLIVTVVSFHALSSME